MRTLKPAFQKLVVAVAVGVMTQLEPCFGAAWEGTDDFSGTLVKWDTNYTHVDNPSDGLFLSNSRIQFIKTTTSTNLDDAVDQSTGVLIWPYSLPNHTNWVVTVDVHLKPLSVMGSVLIPDSQDIQAALYLYESLYDLTNSPDPKQLQICLNNGVTNNVVRTDGEHDSDVPVLGGGWDFTLGISFDAQTQKGTCFYFPTNQASQLVVLTNRYMGGWTNIRVMLLGSSEYWAVSPGEVWLDNFRVSGTAISAPIIAITKTAPQSSLTNGLVAYYPFNGNANDASGNGHNGSAQNTFATTNQFGEPNSALGFAGNSWVYVPYSASLFTTNYSVSMMFKSQIAFASVSSASFCLLRSGNASTDLWRGYEIIAVDGGKNFGFWDFNQIFVGDGKCVTPIANWQQHRWYNLTFTRNGLIAQLYRDGVLIASATNTTPYTPAQSSPLYIGSNTHDPATSDPTVAPGGNYFTGIISDVRFYNRGLSSIEVQQLYNEQSQPSTPSLNAVELSFSNLMLGRNYQLQVSGNLVNWTNQGSAFTAISTDMVYPQYWETEMRERLFFRLQLAP